MAALILGAERSLSAAAVVAAVQARALRAFASEPAGADALSSFASALF
jgi:hypothetical protein